MSKKIILFILAFVTTTTLAKAENEKVPETNNGVEGTMETSSKFDEIYFFILKKNDKNKLRLHKGTDGDEYQLVTNPSEEELVEARNQIKEKKINEYHLGNRFENWELMFGSGMAIPNSNNFFQNYNSAFDFNYGIGYKLSNVLTILMEVDNAGFFPKNNTMGGSFNFGISNVGFLGKIRFSSRGIRPYVFAGPGIAFNSYNLNFTYQGLNASASKSEDDFLMEAGLGLEVPLIKGIYIFLQGKMSYVFMTNNYSNFGSVDNLTGVIPVQAGVVFSN